MTKEKQSRLLAFLNQEKKKGKCQRAVNEEGSPCAREPVTHAVKDYRGKKYYLCGQCAQYMYRSHFNLYPYRISRQKGSDTGSIE